MFHLRIWGKEREPQPGKTEGLLAATPPQWIHTQSRNCIEQWCFMHISSPITVS